MNCEMLYKLSQSATCATINKLRGNTHSGTGKSAVLDIRVKIAQHKIAQLKSARDLLVGKVDPSWTLQARGTLYIWRLYG